MTHASEETVNLAFAALDYGVDYVRRGGFLLTFTMTETDAGVQSVKRFAGATCEASVEAACRSMSRIDAKRAALVYVRRLPFDGTWTDTVIAEVYEAGAPASFVIGQRYRRTRACAEFEVTANPISMGTSPRLFE